jgi:pyochelin synthetase
MSAGDLIIELEELGVRLWEESGQLRFRAPQGVMTADRVAALKAAKQDVLAALRAGDDAVVLTSRPTQWHEPFPLTDVQAAYLLGRRDNFSYGGVGCHGYGELSYPELDVPRLERAWQALVARHDMLRAVIDISGSQRVLPEVADYRVEVADLADAAEEDAEDEVLATRAELESKVYPPDEWPLFELRVTHTPTRSVLHLSIDFLICDFVSIQVLLDQLHLLYADPERVLPPLQVTFRDYLLAEKALRSGSRYSTDRDYWWGRVDDLPPAPELPVVARPSSSGRARFHRWQSTLTPDEWTALKGRASTYGVTPSVAVLSAYAEVIGRWSRQPAFTLNLTLLNRLPMHPQVDELVGDFTSVNLLAVRRTEGSTLAERATATQARLWQDMDHRLCSGVEVIREIARRDGAAAALMPVVFTSGIGLAAEPDPTIPTGEMVHGGSQTPQVWIDCQNAERDGGLATNWDVRDGVFPPGLVDDMFTAYADLLRAMAADDVVWRASSPVALPSGQAERRTAYNDTDGPVPTGLLHEGVLAQAIRTPERIAVTSTDRTVTYGELLRRATAVTRRLREDAVRPGDVVAVVMDKGVEQVAAVLGILMAGAAYLPVDTNQPPVRRDLVLDTAEAVGVLSQSWVIEGTEWPAGRTPVAVDELEPVDAPTVLPAPLAEPDHLAYVIYTSGSTGRPKGVMIDHRGALNTVVDINSRFGLTEDDRVVGLANLGFDLSVWDVFGTLSVGGRLVLPDPTRRGDPSHWCDLLVDAGVTVWNSVPAQLQMLVDYLESVPEEHVDTLRLAMLSGDWIPVTLPDRARTRIPGLTVTSLGGATEASIWSIGYPITEVDPEWPSIPYGRPLTNQTCHVLDAALRDCPEWAVGELYIGGIGVAMGYQGDATRTAERFVVDPHTRRRLYRTGDLGRFLPDGVIEFLGREDSQVKIRGHRIELAEVHSALLAHPAVASAVVLVDGDQPLERRLVAAVEPGVRDGAEARDAEFTQGLHAAAVRAGERVRLGVDAERVAEFAVQMDDTALLAMVHTLRGEGLFAGPSDEHTLDDILATARVSAKHHRLIRRWLGGLTRHGYLRRDPVTGRYACLRQVSAQDVAQAWQRTERMAAEVNHGADLIKYFRVATEHLPELMREDLDPVQLLFPEGRLDIHESAYNENVLSRYLNGLTVAACRHIAESEHPADRPLRLLEVGAGVGGTSIDLIPALDGLDVDYLFTDVSQFFMNKAEERFAQYPWVRYGTFDMNTDYRAQGFAPTTFDVIVCANVMHYARHAGHALARLRELLTPGGCLVFIETTKDNYQILTSMEFLFDATNNDFDDIRHGRDQTFIAHPEWETLLAEAGAHTALCLPGPDDPLARVGMYTFVARFNSDRAPLEISDLTGHLAARLPEYMVPGQVQVVDAIPTTANGKVDRKTVAGWLARRTGERSAVGGGQPRGEVETRLSALWCEILKVPELGRDDDFFTLGGDSLLAAQLVTQVLDRIPEAEGVFFDSLLQVVLQGASVASLAAHLTGEHGDADATQAPAASPLVALGGDGSATPVVLVHGGAGDLAGYRDLAARLAERGPVLGITLSDPAPYLAADVDSLVERVAGTYARRLLAEGHTSVHLAGYGFGGTLASEVARQFTESGGDVVALTVVAAYPPPYDVADDLLAEHLFARSLGVDPTVLGYPGTDEMESLVAEVRANTPDVVADGSLAAVGDAGPAEAVTALRELAECPSAERLAAIAEAVAVLGGGMSPGEAVDRFSVFRHSLRAAGRYRPAPYLGDMTLVRPGTAEGQPLFTEDMSSYWREVCLGDLHEVDVDALGADELPADAVDAVAAVLLAAAGEVAA